MLTKDIFLLIIGHKFLVPAYACVYICLVEVCVFPSTFLVIGTKKTFHTKAHER